MRPVQQMQRMLWHCPFLRLESGTCSPTHVAGIRSSHEGREGHHTDPRPTCQSVSWTPPHRVPYPASLHLLSDVVSQASWQA